MPLRFAAPDNLTVAGQESGVGNDFFWHFTHAYCSHATASVGGSVTWP
jgi:hypothetical protein